MLLPSFLYMVVLVYLLHTMIMTCVEYNIIMGYVVYYDAWGIHVVIHHRQFSTWYMRNTQHNYGAFVIHHSHGIYA